MHDPSLCRIFFVAAALLIGSSSCSGSSDRGDGISNEVIAACAAFARTECDMADSCQGGVSTLVFGSAEACAGRTATACERRVTSSGESVGTTDLMTCQSNQLAQTCDEWVGTLTPGCGFIGTHANGAPCLFNSQCASGFCDDYLYYTERNVCGVCANPPAEGEACSSSCGGDGTVQCVHDGDAGYCVRLGGPRQACDAGTPCGTGLACATPAGATSGQCLPATGGVGDACDDETGPFCDYRRQIHCNRTIATCEVAQSVAPGARCGLLADGSVAQCASGACQAAASELTGTCVPFLQDGAVCTFGPGSTPCEPPALCASGICRIVGGELCE